MLPLPATASSSHEEQSGPKLTLYRDTNGWCPFCERVWLGLREKGIPFDEVLINLYDKPQWYKDMVPTTMVPAIKFAGSGEVVWESDAILRRLDEAFPEVGPMLFREPGQMADAKLLIDRFMNASMGISYSVGNRTEAEIDAKRVTLVQAIDDLDGRLRAGGPFLLGAELSAADCMAVPMLERYGVQMPFTAAGVKLRDAGRWPGLAAWYDAMESRPSYASRVQGDAYSWTVVAPVMMRLFGGQNGTLSGPAADRADRAAQAARALLDEMVVDAEAGASAKGPAPAGSPRAEAAAKLVANHEAVVRDATSTTPKSQLDLTRLAPESAPTVDAALRAAAAALLAGARPELPSGVETSEVAAACRYVSARLSAPRDLGAPAAAELRGALLHLAKLGDASGR